MLQRGQSLLRLAMLAGLLMAGGVALFRRAGVWEFAVLAVGLGVLVYGAGVVRWRLIPFFGMLAADLGRWRGWGATGSGGGERFERVGAVGAAAGLDAGGWLMAVMRALDREVGGAAKDRGAYDGAWERVRASGRAMAAHVLQPLMAVAWLMAGLGLAGLVAGLGTGAVEGLEGGRGWGGLGAGRGACVLGLAGGLVVGTVYFLLLRSVGAAWLAMEGCCREAIGRLSFGECDRLARFEAMLREGLFGVSPIGAGESGTGDQAVGVLEPVEAGESVAGRLRRIEAGIRGGVLVVDAAGRLAVDRAERQHAETVAYLELLGRILTSSVAGRGRGEGGAEAWRQEPILVMEASGRPVTAMTMTTARFAVGLGGAAGVSAGGEAGVGGCELVGGGFVRIGAFSRPLVRSVGHGVAGRVGRLEGHSDVLVRLLPEANRLEVGDWTGGGVVSLACGEGRLEADCLGILSGVGGAGVVAVAVAGASSNGGGTLRVVRWGLGGGGGGAGLEVLATMEGRVVAFATRPGEQVAFLVRGVGGAVAVVLVRAGRAPVSTPFGVRLRALAFAPDGTLWCLEEGGTAGTWDPIAGKYVRRRGFLAVDRFVVTAGGDLVGINAEGRLMAARVSDASVVRRVGSGSNACALAISPGGEHLLIGHEDGTVLFRDASQPLV